MNTTANNASPSQPDTRVRLDLFDPGKGLDRGRSRATEAAWYLIKWVFFLSPMPWPQVAKHLLLRAFGARLGTGIVIKPRVNIHLPWKLSVGDHAWIGEETFILNFEPVTIGSHACLSQRTFICAGNHDYRDPSFGYRNAPIHIGAGAWLGAQSFVCPGVTVGNDAVAAAGSVVTANLPDGMVCAGNPCKPHKPRWRPEDEAKPQRSPQTESGRSTRGGSRRVRRRSAFT